MRQEAATTALLTLRNDGDVGPFLRSAFVSGPFRLVIGAALEPAPPSVGSKNLILLCDEMRSLLRH